MPQLNPNPWFFIMIISWFTYSMLIQPKLTAFITMNQPSSKAPTIASTTPWDWPWT